MKIAVYPGSFDPITNGHISIIRRGLNIFDKLIVVVANNPEKKTLFTLSERRKMIHKIVINMGREMKVVVDSFNGLLVDYVELQQANAILRGIRALSDFDYEFQLALMNRKLNRRVQSVFLMTDYKWLYVSSTIVKEVARLGGNITELVPKVVYKKLANKYPLLKKRLNQYINEKDISYE